ncbi:PEPxxWA-CTERM sorting domain-containing protein [Sphingomonas sp. ID0503]|uniref:PEPxxWA-CTERM sorting domain-containing protein n=1 Tax=Sphingomonas sp. ID0503 TaxID=3399691 RepID=UPI003AFA532B
MIRSLLASKTTKLVAACVCPVAGTGALTAAVPQVRQAVHKATGPRAYAAPKTRVRPAGAAPCQQSAGDMPTVGNAPLALVDPAPVAAVPAAATRVATAVPRSRNGNVPLDPVGNVPANIGAVPETATWAQLIVGFGLAGHALRSATKNRSSGETGLV